MAQVKVYALREVVEASRAALSDAIHGAVMAALDFPAEKRFHRFMPMERADLIHPADRSDRYTIIEISMFEGRSVEAKKRLVRELYARIPAATGIEPQDIEITIFETPRHAWGIRGMAGDEIGLGYKVEV